MLINNIMDMKNCEYTVFTYSDRFPHNALNYYFKDKTVDIFEIKLKRKIEKTSVTPIECLFNTEQLDKVEAKVRCLDVLVVSGGGWLEDSWCSRTDKFTKVIIPIIVANKYKIPVVFMSQSIGPINSASDNMRSLFNICLIV